MKLTTTVGEVLASLAATLVVLLIGYALWDSPKQQLRTTCKDLEQRIAVYMACYPQTGCMATYHDALQLTRDIEACKGLVGASPNR